MPRYEPETAELESFIGKHKGNLESLIKFLDLHFFKFFDFLTLSYIYFHKSSIPLNDNFFLGELTVSQVVT